MGAKELGKLLNDMYQNAPRGEQVTMIHLFGIKYSADIKRSGIKEVVKEAGINSTYSTEISKAINLSKYVKAKNSPYDPVFVTEVLKGEQAKNEGKKGLRVDVENLWK